MSGAHSDLRTSYAAAFGEYVADRTEVALQAAHELGRDAVRRDLSVLDLAAIHHEVLLDALVRLHDREQIAPTTQAAEDFFVESLSAFEIVRRGYREAREEALVERRQTAILRQLSTFLGDASLAFGTAESLAEVLQLVAEHAREVLDSDACTVTLGESGLSASSEGEEAGADDAGARLEASLTALDGREVGSIELRKRDGRFSELDEAMLMHLAQMASAAVERARTYAARR